MPAVLKTSDSLVVIFYALNLCIVSAKNTEYFNVHYNLSPYISKFKIDHHRDIASENYNSCTLNVNI
jgi:hypothetical protein